MACIPAREMTKLKPNPDQTVITAIEGRAVCTLVSKPGCGRCKKLTSAFVTFVEGSKIKAQITLALAREIAMLEVKMVRKMPMPRTFARASQANPSPQIGRAS